MVGSSGSMVMFSNEDVEVSDSYVRLEGGGEVERSFSAVLMVIVRRFKSAGYIEPDLRASISLDENLVIGKMMLVWLSAIKVAGIEVKVV